MIKLYEQRHSLSKYINSTVYVKGHVHKFGKYISKFNKGNRIYAPTLLLKDVNIVKGSDEFLFKHMWLKLPQKFVHKNIQVGDLVSFKATVIKYRKYGDRDYSFIHSYGLDNIKEFEIMEKNEGGLSLIEYYANYLL